MLSAIALTAAIASTGALAPPFPTRDARKWIGTPVTWSDLRGRVVLLDVWTFG